MPLGNRPVRHRCFTIQIDKPEFDKLLRQGLARQMLAGEECLEPFECFRGVSKVPPPPPPPRPASCPIMRSPTRLSCPLPPRVSCNIRYSGGLMQCRTCPHMLRGVQVDLSAVSYCFEEVTF